jgi:hypothetical protein
MAHTEKTPGDMARLVWKILKDRSLDPPNTKVLAKIFEALFFTSLRTEELEPLRCSLTYLDPNNPDPDPPLTIPHDRWRYYTFGERIGLSVSNLAKLANAVDPNAASIAIYSDAKGKIFIWGVLDQFPVHRARFISYETDRGPEVPGLFNAVITGIGELSVWRKYDLLGRLKQSVLLTTYHDVLHFGPVSDRIAIHVAEFIQRVLKELEPNDGASRGVTAAFGFHWRAILCRLLVSIRNYRKGGAILIVPGADRTGLKLNYLVGYQRLSESLVGHVMTKILHDHNSRTIEKEYRATAGAVPFQLQEDASKYLNENNNCRAAIAGAIAMVASLTRVDGLVLLDEALNVRAFGVEILAEKDISRVFIANGATATIRQLRSRDPQNYGTRHRSMMRYVAQNAKSLGFVVSHDGDVRAVINLRGKVIMWENIQLHLTFDADALENKSRK